MMDAAGLLEGPFSWVGLGVGSFLLLRLLVAGLRCLLLRPVVELAGEILLVALGAILMIRGAASLGAEFGLVPDRAGARAMVLAYVALALASLAMRVTEVILWRRTVARGDGLEPPRLLRRLLGTLIYGLAGLVVASLAFAWPATGLFVSSGVVVGLAGLALQSTLKDLVAGLTITLERPFWVGDWIALESGEYGKVKEIGWKCVYLENFHGYQIMVPNSRTVDVVTHNYSAPQPTYADWFHVNLPPEVDPMWARRLLLEATLQCPLVLREPPPYVHLVEGGDRPFRYLIYMWFPDYVASFHGRDQVFEAIWRTLGRNGLSPVAAQQDVRLARAGGPPPEAPDLATVLADVSMLAPLSEAERGQLLAGLEPVRWLPHTTVVRQGAPGTSLFVVMGGLLRVDRVIARGGQVQVAYLSCGDTFGEGSLLTGEPRSATVTTLTECYLVEILKESLDPVLHARPELAEALGRTLAERRHGIALAEQALPAVGWRQRVDELTRRIRRFFDLR